MTSSILKPPIVANTGPLIALATVDHVGLLDELFHVIVPEAVREELEAGEHISGKHSLVRALHRFAEFHEPSGMDPLLPIELDAGEASVIQCAREMHINVVLIDERKGRRLARRVYGLQTIGTARILVECKLRGLLPAVGPVLEAMRQEGYWINESIVAWAKSRVGE